MANRAEKLRRRQHRKEKKRRSAVNTNYMVPDGPMAVVAPPGELKMSDALLQLVKPYWDSCKDEQDMRKQLMLGMIAWNMSLLPAEKRAQSMAEYAASFPPSQRDDFRMVIEPLIHRKELLFPDNRRPMLDYRLTEMPNDEIYVEVVFGL